MKKAEDLFQFKEGQEVYFCECSNDVTPEKGRSLCVKKGTVNATRRVYKNDEKYIVWYGIDEYMVAEQDIRATKEEILELLVEFTGYTGFEVTSQS